MLYQFQRFARCVLSVETDQIVASVTAFSKNIQKECDIIKNIFTFIIGILSVTCILTSSAILWYLMVQTSCKMTIIGIMSFLVGSVLMKHYIKNT